MVGVARHPVTRYWQESYYNWWKILVELLVLEARVNSKSMKKWLKTPSSTIKTYSFRIYSTSRTSLNDYAFQSIQGPNETLEIYTDLTENYSEKRFHFKETESELKYLRNLNLLVKVAC